MIAERTLREWRRQALREKESLQGWDSSLEMTSHRRETADRILRLTQDLLDLNLLAKYRVQGSSGGRICLEHPNMKEVEKKS